MVVADIEFNTVDGFQGREVDILLLSTVRAAHSSVTSEINSNSIGFVADVRRLNVALTRARLSLWILGNARTLQTNQNWAALVKDAKERNLIMMAKMPYHSMFKTDKNKCFVENSDNRARPSKHEKKVKDSDQSVTKKFVLGKDTAERKKKCIASEVRGRNKVNGDKNSFSALGKDAPCNEKKSEDEHVSITKDMGHQVAKYESRSSCGDMCTMSDQQVCNGGREGKDKSKTSMGKTTLGKRQLKFQHSRYNLDSPMEETGGGHEGSKLSVSERLTKHSGGNKSSSTEISASSMKCCHKERDAVDQGRAPNQNKVADQSKVAEISKRKQQREAVDAILYSSLITAKKDEKLSKKVSAKRPLPSSVAGGSTMPPKRKSGKLLLLCLLILYDFTFF